MVKSQEQWGIAIPWYYKKHNPFYNLHNANFSIQYSFKLQQQSASCHFQGRTVVYISVSDRQDHSFTPFFGFCDGGDGDAWISSCPFPSFYLFSLFSQSSFSFPSCSVVQSSIPFHPTFPYTNDHQETWISKTKASLGLVLDVPIFLPHVYQD